MIFLTVILAVAQLAYAQTESTCIYIFCSIGCPHCSNAVSYIESIEGSYPEVELVQINAMLGSSFLNELYDKHSVPDYARESVPILFIGDRYLLGEFSIVGNIESYIQDCQTTGCGCQDMSRGVSIYQFFALVAIMTAMLANFLIRKRDDSLD